MSTLSYAVRDSATMLRRNLRHALRYPATIIVTLAIPVMLLLLFVGVFGGAMSAGLGGGVHAAATSTTSCPGILLMTIGVRGSGTALAVNRDMTEGIIARFRTMAISRRSVLIGHVVGRPDPHAGRAWCWSSPSPC